MLISASVKRAPLLLAGAVALSIPFAGVAQALTFLDQIGPRTTIDELNVRASQDFETAYDSFDVAYIDDFNIDFAVRLNQVEAVFVGFGGFSINPSQDNPPQGNPLDDYSNVKSWRVEIYSSKEKAITGHLTGDIASLVSDQAFLKLVSGTKTALVSIPIAVNLNAPGTYWLGIIPRLDFLPGNKQLGVANSSYSGFPNNLNAVQVNPKGGFKFSGNILEFRKNAAYRVQGEAIPTPALLPGLIGLGIGMWRKRKQQRSPE